LGASFGALGAAIGAVAARNRLQEVIANLQSISPTVTETLYSSYQLDRTKIRMDKKATVKLVVLDTKKSQVRVYEAKAAAEVSVDVYSGVHDKDERKSYLLSGKRDMESFIEAPLKFDLSDPLEQIAQSQLKSIRKMKGTLKSALKFAEVKKQFASSHSRRAGRSIGRASPLMRSVVLIETDQGKLGAGFFIDKNHVLTNNHVVDGVKYADITMATGQKSFGKVIKRSHIKDLALIKVNATGIAAIFHSGEISAGDEVFALGHPKGLSFSITRGIVSTTRRLPLASSDAPPVNVIQTDAAINTGNSGGPLFLKGKVIGVNTLTVRKDIGEGLGFAVHIDEVREFLR